MNLEALSKLVSLVAGSEGFASLLVRILAFVEHPKAPAPSDIEQLALDLERTISDMRAAKKFGEPSP